MKKLIGILVLLALCVCSLGGCDNGSTDGSVLRLWIMKSQDGKSWSRATKIESVVGAPVICALVGSLALAVRKKGLNDHRE